MTLVRVMMIFLTTILSIPFPTSPPTALSVHTSMIALTTLRQKKKNLFTQVLGLRPPFSGQGSGLLSE